MKIKHEPTGHGHRKGTVQMRWSFFLKNGDHRYAEFGSNDPCHNHFEYYSSAVTDAWINNRKDALLDEFEPNWNADKPPYIFSSANTAFTANPSQALIDACNAKADDIKGKSFEKEKNGGK